VLALFVKFPKTAVQQMAKSAAAVVVAGAAVLLGICWKYLPESVLVLLGAVSVSVPLLLLLGSRTMFCLGQDQQLRVQRFTATTVHNGPGLVFLNPCGYRSAEVRKAEMLGSMDFVSITDVVTGSERVERGPQLLFLSAHEIVSKRGQGISLTSAEYVMVENKMTGEKTVIKGPSVWFPGPHDKAQQGSSISLNRTEYIFVEDQLTGEAVMVKGPCVWFPKPFDRPSQKHTAIPLQDDEYMLLKDSASGQRWIQRGKDLVFLEPTWKILGSSRGDTGIKKALVLKVDEYIRLLDVSTGKVTVHRGERKVFPGPDDEVLDGGKQKAVKIDDEHAVLVRDTGSGQLRLVTEKQLFVPGANEVIEEVRDLIRLAEHEAMIIKDKDGAFQYYYGSSAKRAPDQPQAFFLPPYAEIQKIWWSRGPRRERKDVSFERFDVRPHFMKFEFNCRTSDNVELILEGVIFWELVDLPAMFTHTGDTSGDMVYHIRSQFILHVARVTLKLFMDTVHDIAKTVVAEDTEFYTKRGIKVHSLEVTRYQCANGSTAEILEQIIQETTNRMNRLSQAESENEVNLFRTEGQVQQAKLNSELLELQRKEAQAEAHVTGLSEADRVATFLKGLENEVPALDDRIKIWQVLRKTEALSVVSQGSANLYFTPNDVDLSIEARSANMQQSTSPVM